MADTDERVSKAAIARRSRERFAVAKRVELDYLRSLRQVARQIDALVKGMAPDGQVQDPEALRQALLTYGQALRPWARSVGERMLASVMRKDEASWIRLGKQIGQSLRQELENAPVGRALNLFLDEQVRLITSLPVEASERVHALVREGLMNSTRAAEIQKEIMKTGSVTESRAKLIARTEVARTASALTMVRAQHVGSTHYIWRTSEDSTVRESHRHMANTVHAWDKPPEVERGYHYHPGMFPNCRCWPEPILPE
jgi:SPP1 gp7 family putative phage head morphogenesis protein